MRGIVQSLSPIAQRAVRLLRPLALGAALAVGVAAGIYLLVVVPAQERLMQAQASYEAAHQTQVRQQAARKTREELAGVWQTLPARKEFPALILAISELAQQELVTIPGMSYTLQKVEEGIAQKATITFRVAGDYPAIRRFLHRLETTDLYLTIERLDATRSPGARRMEVVFNVQVATYLRPDAPTVAGRA